MNEHFFSTKRAFHAVLRITRKPLKSFGLTAARYDLMHVLFEYGGRDPRACSIYQSALRRRLGVCKSVVSRMLRALEKLGLVKRRRGAVDTRQRWVELTESGLKSFRDAKQCLMRASRRLLCLAICFGEHRDLDKCFQHMSMLEAYLHGMRAHYGDPAPLYLYTWHPDD